MTTPQQIEHAAHQARATLDHYHQLEAQIETLRQLIEDTDPNTEDATITFRLLVNREAQRRRILETVTALIADTHQPTP